MQELDPKCIVFVGIDIFWPFILQDNDEEPLSEEGDRIVVEADQGKVHFRPLKKEDEGNYKCKASNDVGFAETTGFVKVVGELSCVYVGTVK